MIYRELGKTGKKVSRLGCGAMRLKLGDSGRFSDIDKPSAKKLFEYCYEQGINLFDTAYMYHGGNSEKVIGEFIKPFRKNIYLSSKSPGIYIKKRGDFRRIFEEQLARLQTDHIEFYFLHAISYDSYFKTKKIDDWMEGALRLKEEGLISHIGFSFHGEEGDIEKLVDLGHFEFTLVQYNLLDRSNEAAISYARQKGLGVFVMGPVGGGRIADFSDEVMARFGIPNCGKTELAFRYVYANADIDCALSGLEDAQMAEENLRYLLQSKPLTAREVERVNRIAEKLKEREAVPCTGCNYCMPCPADVNIPHIFKAVNNYKNYGMKEYARKSYAEIGVHPWVPGARADMCTECGQCLEKCPQKIEIIEELKTARKILE